MKQFKVIIVLTIIFIMLIFPINTILATDTKTKNYNPDNINTNSPSIILMDAKTGKILYSKDALKKMYPASTTKLMTAILTLENCKLTDIVTVSHNAIFSIPIGYSHASLKEGENLTVEELLNVLLIPSANDAAIALAEHIAGSVEEFAKMMNNKAKEIGCLNTNFINPNGVHNENHYSTAYDLALIGKYAYSNSIINSIASKEVYDLPKNAVNNHTVYKSTIALLRSDSKYYYEYANGLKTGYTDPAGYCIIATAKKDDMNLLAVVLNGRYLDDGTATRESDCIKLFNYGFENYTSTALIKEGDVAKTINVINGTDESDSLDLVCTNTLDCVVDSGEVIDITPVINLTNVIAPIAKGEVIGTITYTIDDIEYSSDLIASHDVYSSDAKSLIIVLSIIFVILLIIVLGFIIPRKNGKA